MVKHVTVIGCGVVGAMVAYELSGLPGLQVTVLDRQAPGQDATRAALGVLMGVISHKVKGRAWAMRRSSLERYDQLIGEVEVLTGLRVPYNCRGLLMLCGEEADRDRWQALCQVRRDQGYGLDWLERSALAARYPKLQSADLQGAVYSPHDRQVNPLLLTEALVAAAQVRGVRFHFGAAVDGFLTTSAGPVSTGAVSTGAVSTGSVKSGLSPSFVQSVEGGTGEAGSPLLQCAQVSWTQRPPGAVRQGMEASARLGYVAAGYSEQRSYGRDGERPSLAADLGSGVGLREDGDGGLGTSGGMPGGTPGGTNLETDYVIVTAGLGSHVLAAQLQAPLVLRPVLGQALQVRLQEPLFGTSSQEPVVTGRDIHIVPILKPWDEGGDQALYAQTADYWVGATVELPDDNGGAAIAQADRLEAVWQGAIAFCPALAEGEIVRTWSGLRPRPEGRSAPVLEKLANYDNVLLATGHYRNGVLLAPATAAWVCERVQEDLALA